MFALSGFHAWLPFESFGHVLPLGVSCPGIWRMFALSGFHAGNLWVDQGPYPGV